MRNTFKNMKKRGIFIAFSKRSKHQIIIFCPITVYPAYFQLFIKHAYVIFVMKDYIIWTEKGKRERNGFSRNHEQKLALGAKKMCRQWHFSPLQKGKKRGVKGRLERVKNLYFRTYFTLFTRVGERRERTRGGKNDLLEALKGIQNKLSKESTTIHNKQNINSLTLIKTFRNTFLQKLYPVIFGHGHFRSFSKKEFGHFEL